MSADRVAGVFVSLPLPPQGWELAYRVSRTKTATIGSRSLDILHVAIALAIKAEAFLTFDKTQAQLAQAEGLATPLKA